MKEITFNGYHLPTVAKLARELGSPINTELAFFIWQVSNHQSLPLLIAEEFMLAAGYQPFLGYPLTRESEVRG